MHIEAVIFDMDGLMIDSERLGCKGYQSGLARYGLTMDRDFYIGFIGRSHRDISDIISREYGPDIDVEELVQYVYRYMADSFINDGVPLKKGLTELLQYLKERGIKAVVATSSNRDRADQILGLAGITEYFDATVCGDEVKAGKPEPEMFLTACKKVNADPKTALILEDSEAGIEAAYRAGIPVICVPDLKLPGERYQQMAFRMEDSLLDVRDLLRDNSDDI